MRKSTLFVSAALTTFMLAVMFGVASAYQKIVKAAGPTEAAAQQSQQTDVVLPTATNSIVGSTMTIEGAADLASNVIGRTDLYSAEIAQLNGVDVYLVTFSSGDIVYVSQNGQILSISKIPVTFISVPAAGGNGGNGGSAAVNPPSSGGNDNSNYNDNGNDDDDDEDHNENEDEHEDDD